jgi:hypothetical protein
MKDCLAGNVVVPLLTPTKQTQPVARGEIILSPSLPKPDGSKRLGQA